MTFEVKLLITFVATYPLVILTKFGLNLIKHVGEEANCEKEEEEEEETRDMCSIEHWYTGEFDWPLLSDDKSGLFPIIFQIHRSMWY